MHLKDTHANYHIQKHANHYPHERQKENQVHLHIQYSTSYKKYRLPTVKERGRGPSELSNCGSMPGEDRSLEIHPIGCPTSATVHTSLFSSTSRSLTSITSSSVAGTSLPSPSTCAFERISAHHNFIINNIRWREENDKVWEEKHMISKLLRYARNEKGIYI